MLVNEGNKLKIDATQLFSRINELTELFQLYSLYQLELKAVFLY